MRKSPGSGERGSSLVEFVMCFALFWVPFFMGMMELGVNLIRALQVTEVCRDAAHMSAFAVDFSDPGNQAILLKVAQGLNLSSNGTGVIILSTITHVIDTDCKNANLPPDPNHCANINSDVVTRRIVIGNSSVRSSAFATPTSSDMDSSGSIAPATYLTDTTCQAPNFKSLITLVWGQNAYLAEMTLNSPDYSSWKPLGSTSSSARSIF